MTQTHTKGPWNCNSGRIYGTSTEYPIAEIFDIYIEGEEAKANASLIAAAPDLLEALEWVIQHAPAGAARDRVQRIIAKARGQA